MLRPLSSGGILLKIPVSLPFLTPGSSIAVDAHRLLIMLSKTEVIFTLYYFYSLESVSSPFLFLIQETLRARLCVGRRRNPIKKPAMHLRKKPWDDFHSGSAFHFVCLITSKFNIYESFILASSSLGVLRSSFWTRARNKHRNDVNWRSCGNLFRHHCFCSSSPAFLIFSCSF